MLLKRKEQGGRKNMWRKMCVVLVGIFLLGTIAMAKQEINGKISDTSRILFLDKVIVDQDPCGIAFEPIVRVVKIPFAGSRDPIVLRIDFPYNLDVYLYLAVSVPGRGDLVYYAGTKINPNLLVAVPPPEGEWKVGTQVVKIILSTSRLWNVKNSALILNSQCCCSAIEVEQLLVITELPPSPRCCTCNFSNFIGGVITGLILYPLIFCGCP